MNGSELKTRQSLIERIRNQEDRESWHEFFNTYRRVIFSLASKSGLTDDEAEEVVQETMVTISRKLDDYVYKPEQCSFRSWIFHKAKWRIIDQIRKRNHNVVPAASGAPDPEGTSTVERIPDENAPKLDALWEQEWQKNLTETALERVKRKVPDRQFQIFELYVLREWPVAEVKKMLGVSTTKIYVVKHRISGLIKKEVKKLEEELG